VDYANVQLYSGSPANLAVTFAVQRMVVIARSQRMPIPARTR